MERQSADLSTTAGSCRRYDSRRPAQRRRSVAIGAQCRGRISGQSPHRSQSLSTIGRRRAGRDQARTGHVRQCRRARSVAQGRTPEVSYRPMARNRRHDSAPWNHAERITESSQDRESKMRSPNLSNTASNLSGFASLRETSPIQGREEFLTLRRQGARKAYESESPVSSLDLSGFASLRETSARQGREEFFTLRRQDAKEVFKSKSPVPSLDLGAFASLRETSAIQGSEDFFTPRRKGAKKAFESKHRISSLDLSGLASLRETSAIQGSEDFFTLRRQDAKKAYQSKSPVPPLDLSGFAPLREHSGIQGTQEFFTLRREDAKRRNKSKYQRFFGHTIGDALNAVLDHVLAEINKEAESFIHQPQIGQDLFVVDRIERSDRFHFHDHEIIDDQIGAEAFVEPDPIPRDRNRYLSFHGVAMFAQFMRKQHFVYDFEDAWPEPSVQAVGRVNDYSRDFILFHRAKLVLLLPACEAKNFRAVVSLRETSATQFQEKFFTLRRQGAKKASKSKNPVSSLDLSGFASLREISARQGREEFFALRRQGAKKAFKSKSPVSFLDLSGFTSLRETSVTQGRKRFSRKGAKAQRQRERLKPWAQ